MNIKGVTAVEYAIMLGVVSLGLAVAFTDFGKVMTQDGTAANDLDINNDGTVDGADLGVIPSLVEKMKSILGEFAEPTESAAPAA